MNMNLLVAGTAVSLVALVVLAHQVRQSFDDAGDGLDDALDFVTGGAFGEITSDPGDRVQEAIEKGGITLGERIFTIFN